MQQLVQLQSTLDQKRQELARLEAELNAMRRQNLLDLASQNGFESTDALIIALAEFASPEIARIFSQQSKTGGRTSPPKVPAYHSKKRKKRAAISEDLLSKVLAEIKRGALVAAEIADKFGISVSAVNQIKRRNGLTRPKKSSTH